MLATACVLVSIAIVSVGAQIGRIQHRLHLLEIAERERQARERLTARLANNHHATAIRAGWEWPDV